MADNRQQPDHNPDSLELGLFINNQYVTVKKLGVGGFGIVWQAYDFSLRNFIAIKELLPEYAENKFVEMFYKEALIAKNIIHDNIVRVQHFWQGSNGSFYVVLDYVRGVDLENLINKCNEMKTVIPWKLSALICMSVLKAIDYANRIARDSITGNAYGIVYRDISPGNVLLSFDGNIKLSDFGIAKTADEIKDSIPQKVITGKYPYMSPEQIKGQQDIDHRTDIFSIGVLFFEMLTGRRLYQGTNEEIKNQVLGQKFDPSLIGDPNIPAELGDVIAKALEKDRDARYERAIEMYRDIRRILKGIETDDLMVELSDFIGKMMQEAHIKSEKLVENVKMLDMGDIQKNPRIFKVQCNDFIAGQRQANMNFQQQVPVQGADMSAGMPPQPPADGQPYPPQYQQPSQPAAGQPQGEAKGKTVFEEVGDWLFRKFDEIKKDVIRVFIALFLALLIFGAIDVFVMQLTPFGKSMYSRIYPPDVVITTTPAGANVTMKTKEGDIVLDKVVSNMPIPVRKVPPGSYIVTTLKEGFKPVQRVVQIEKSDKSKKTRREKIDIMFDFVLNVDSEPKGASVFVDGNKFGETPCKVQLLAGPHTIKLSLNGFDDLGSNAKEAKEGQCNIDFTKTSVEEMFAGVDRRFWTCELKNIDGENIFSIYGELFKQVKIVSDPQKMIVHVHGEKTPRGETNLTQPFKVGTYSIRFLDPSARYGEAVKELVVNAKSKNELFVKMNKIVLFKVKSKDSPNDVFITKVKISNKNYEFVKEISTSKPVRLPLPVDVYNVTFFGDNEYKTLTLKNVDISSISTVVGELEYTQVSSEIRVKSEKTGKPLVNAFVWLNNKVIGRTDKNGSFKDKFKPGKYEFKVVAREHEDQICSIDLLAGRKNVMDVVMVRVKTEEEIEAAKAAASNNLSLPGAGSDGLKLKERNKNNASKDSDSKDTAKDQKAKAVKEEPKEQPAVIVSEKEDKKKKEEEVAKDEGGEQQVLVCLNCGYVNTAPKGKKLRFCVNCAKPLK